MEVGQTLSWGDGMPIREKAAVRGTMKPKIDNCGADSLMKELSVLALIRNAYSVAKWKRFLVEKDNGRKQHACFLPKRNSLK